MNTTLNDITIDPEFRDLCPALRPEELKFLEDSLRGGGMISPLVVWKYKGQTILVDGHNRFALWQKFEGFDDDFPFLTTEVFLGDRQGAIDWIIESQLGRRNLSQADFQLLLGKLYNSRKKSKSQAGAKGGASKGQNDPCLPDSTADVIAKEHGVSPKTVKRAGKLVEAVEEIQKSSPEILKADAVKQAKAKIKPDPAPAPERPLADILARRWNAFIKDIPVTKHKEVRIWLTRKLQSHSL